MHKYSGNTSNKHVLQTNSQIIYKRITSYNSTQNISKLSSLNAFYECIRNTAHSSKRNKIALKYLKKQPFLLSLNSP